MAAYLNRTVSMMSGDGPHNRSPMPSLPDHRQIRNSADNSPLQIFVKAKKKINDIFGEIEDYVKDSVHYMQGNLQIDFTNCLLHLILMCLLKTCKKNQIY